jgi:hypothetical protein
MESSDSFCLKVAQFLLLFLLKDSFLCDIQFVLFFDFIIFSVVVTESTKLLLIDFTYK